MSRKVADVLCEMLANAGVKRCYGIVGDALNPFIDALRRNGRIDFIQVRHEEYGVFAAVSEAYLTGNPVAVCGTAGPGVVHLFNGLMDARKEGAPIIAIAGDVETSILDTFTLEELKSIVDEALEKCPTVKNVVVYRRSGSDVTMKAGRDVWAGRADEHLADDA